MSDLSQPLAPDRVQSISRSHGLLNKCVLVYLVALVVTYIGKASSPALHQVAIVVFVASIFAAFIATILLSLKVHHWFVTVVFGLLSLVPVVGVLFMLLTSNRANKLLRASGHRIGFFGSIKDGSGAN